MTSSPDDRPGKPVDWAEDRTSLANERTFAGWLRTGLASVGVGLGANAIFGGSEPAWIAKLAATIFILIGVFIFWGGYRHALAVRNRLLSDLSAPVRASRLTVLTVAFTVAALLIVLAMWAI